MTRLHGSHTIERMGHMEPFLTPLQFTLSFWIWHSSLLAISI